MFFFGKISRKNFLKYSFTSLLFFLARSFFGRISQVVAAPDISSGRLKRTIQAKYDLTVVKGEDPYLATARAIEELGGMDKFVGKNSTVLIKPNIGWDRAPEQAANTNPQVVAALIDLCYKAGAKRVNVFDNTCNEARRCYSNSGIEKAAKEHKANVFFADEWDVVKAKFKYKSQMENWPIFRDALECDTFINVPVLKHHGLAGLTLSMKNLMGICSGVRGAMHLDIGKKLVDLTDFINPELTVIDAFRFLKKHGPVGGSLEDVVLLKTIIAGTDPTLIDSFACAMVDKDPRSVPYINHAIERNFGKFDLEKANISRVTV